MADSERAKKDRDPIFMASLAIFTVAVIMIAGVFIADNYLSADDRTVEYGSSVKVNYTGSYYDYYDGEVAVVFDTSVKSIGENDDYRKSNTYSKGSFSEFSVTVGSGGALKMFEEQLVGHKVGDKVRFMIPVGEGYTSAASPVTKSISGYQFATAVEMTKSDFNSLYKGIDVKTDGTVSSVFTSIYGWDAQASYVTTTGSVKVMYYPVAGTTYDYQFGEDAKPFGKIQFKVTAVTSNSITGDWVFSDYTKIPGTSSEVQMIEFNLDGKKVYITNIDSGTFTFKTTAERDNIALFFSLTIESIE